MRSLKALRRETLARLKEQGEVVTKWRWTAAMDVDTCDRCRRLDGRILTHEGILRLLDKHICDNREDGCRCGPDIEEIYGLPELTSRRHRRGGKRRVFVWLLLLPFRVLRGLVRSVRWVVRQLGR